MIRSSKRPSRLAIHNGAQAFISMRFLNSACDSCSTINKSDVEDPQKTACFVDCKSFVPCPDSCSPFQRLRVYATVSFSGDIRWTLGLLEFTIYDPGIAVCFAPIDPFFNHLFPHCPHFHPLSLFPLPLLVPGVCTVSCHHATFWCNIGCNIDR